MINPEHETRYKHDINPDTNKCDDCGMSQAHIQQRPEANCIRKAIKDIRGVEGCGVCLRDNSGGTHSALERAGHLNHEYIPASEVRGMNALKRQMLRSSLQQKGTNISEHGPLGLEQIAARSRGEDSGPAYAELAQERPSGPQRSALLLAVFSETNASRCSRWHPGFPAHDSWTIADWSNALAGEVGELANVIKKIRRIDTQHFSKRPDEQDRAELQRKAGEEIGDVLAYLDLLATKLGLDLATVAVDKFNAISIREDFSERIEL